MEDWVLPKIDYERCTLCGACVTGCSESALQMSESGPVFTHPERCTYCIECEALCPSDAITCELEISWGDE